MKAAIFHGPKMDMTIEDVKLDNPRPKEVRIRTSFAGICHSDLHFVDGLFPFRAPAILGHESAGVVEEVGSDVTYVKPGDHVITCLSIFCGHCNHCLSGFPNRCGGRATARKKGDAPRLSLDGEPVAQFAQLSSYAEELLVHENAIVKIREDMPLDRAALIGCGVTTGAGAALRTANVEAGSTVAVIGCGGVGLSAINGAAIAGAGRIIAVDRLDSKLELAKDFGATDVVNASNGDSVEQVIELTKGGVDYSFEAIGLKTTCEDAWKMLGVGGVATIIGMVPAGESIEINGMDLLQEKKLQGSMMGSNRFRIDMPRYVDFYLSGKLKLDPLISHRIPLSEINAGMAALKTGEVARQVITFA
ncbi:MAG: Zn-dependent alcohol dehydrogenase [Pseudomonadales bacterium]|nr:Zn-dependent alcohol dehydrogenase [Pseudomonadales bacterium]